MLLKFKVCRIKYIATQSSQICLIYLMLVDTYISEMDMGKIVDWAAAFSKGLNYYTVSSLFGFFLLTSTDQNKGPPCLHRDALRKA